MSSRNDLANWECYEFELRNSKNGSALCFSFFVGLPVRPRHSGVERG